MYKLLIFFLSVIVLVSACPINAQEQTGITTTATAFVSVRPDIAIVVLGVVNEDVSAAAAAASNAATTNAVINALRGFGVVATDIDTIGYTVTPVMDHRRTPAVTVAYRVSNMIRVRHRNLADIGRLIDTALAAGANNVQNVTFAVENDAVPRREAVVRAVEEARAKAQVIADALGVRVGRPISVSEASVGIPMPRMMAEAAVSPTPIMPEDVDVSASVTVTFAIL